MHALLRSELVGTYADVSSLKAGGESVRTVNASDLITADHWQADQVTGRIAFPVDLPAAITTSSPGNSFGGSIVRIGDA